VDVPAFAKVLLDLRGTDDDLFSVKLKNLIYETSFKKILVYVNQFAHNNNASGIVNNFIYLTCDDRTVTYNNGPEEKR
jgi:hypothetical protein